MENLPCVQRWGHIWLYIRLSGEDLYPAVGGSVIAHPQHGKAPVEDIHPVPLGLHPARHNLLGGGIALGNIFSCGQEGKLTVFQHGKAGRAVRPGMTEGPGNFSDTDIRRPVVAGAGTMGVTPARSSSWFSFRAGRPYSARVWFTSARISVAYAGAETVGLVSGAGAGFVAGLVAGAGFVSGTAVVRTGSRRAVEGGAVFAGGGTVVSCTGKSVISAGGAVVVHVVVIRAGAVVCTGGAVVTGAVVSGAVVAETAGVR